MEQENNLKKYYFTFGQNHKLKTGYDMKHHWVCVEEEGYIKARELFMEKFSEELERPLAWAFQYEEEYFNNNCKEYFKLGEYKLIKK